MTILSESPHKSEIARGGCNAAPRPRAPLSGFLGIEPMSEECYEFASFRLFPKQRTLLLDAERVAIGGRGFDLLLLLVSQAGNVVSLRELMHVVWPNITVEEANLRVQIRILRKVLSQCDEAMRAIDTIPLRGYCFVLPVRHHPNESGPSGLEVQTRCVLPILPNLTVGRESAIQIVHAALHERRLVTITGPGGIGKTTVAVATAKRYATNFSGVINFVDLSHVTDGADAARVIGEALQIAPHRDALEALCEHLRFHESLLILDTCEHIVEPIAMLAEVLLSHCTDLKLLVTSREVLRATGEWTYRLPSLTFPAAATAIDQAGMAEFSAVTLFVDRVQSSTSFQPQEQDLPTIAEICRRLDGIPLALEFAAARVTDLGLRKIAAHLNNCFAILTRGRRTALPRHRTLTAAFDWSYGLLSEEEQIMLSHLAALGGSFTADRAVSSCMDHRCKRPSEAFYGLYDKSLLTADMTNDEPVFRLLDTTRAYVADKGKLAPRPDLALVRRDPVRVRPSR
jgi:predicted ATPase/DNA-binding winged helix-turn-helix (wHTH) protein